MWEMREAVLDSLYNGMVELAMENAMETARRGLSACSIIAMRADFARQIWREICAPRSF